jgi:hypothetical protein
MVKRVISILLLAAAAMLLNLQATAQGCGSLTSRGKGRAKLTGKHRAQKRSLRSQPGAKYRSRPSAKTMARPWENDWMAISFGRDNEGN